MYTDLKSAARTKMEEMSATCAAAEAKVREYATVVCTV
jgi:hypothetical protein